MPTSWHRLGPVEQFTGRSLQQVRIGELAIALSYRDGTFGAISGVCNHAGGPLGDGTLSDAGYAVCPWHGWQFHRLTGESRPGYEAAVPRHDVKVEDGVLFVDLTPATPRLRPPNAPHPLTREIVRAPGPLRVVGISTTAMNEQQPRYSTSEDLLELALAQASSDGAETKLIRLGALSFRHCEGYYSKSAGACTWPCTITQMDAHDQLTEVYEALVFWADVVLVATSIRWGAASSLYFKMIERMNCIQNQITTHDRVLIRNKVAGFVITGGQDNVQAVAGQMMLFFSELGFIFPQFPFVAHSRGWTAEDMENNVVEVQTDEDLRGGARALAGRCLALAGDLVACGEATRTIERGGRKGSSEGTRAP
jgi:nitrite reductase/ring-hydroxylating ferredoxin subunit/multimeric flavodoxin WrbA